MLRFSFLSSIIAIFVLQLLTPPSKQEGAQCPISTNDSALFANASVEDGVLRLNWRRFVNFVRSAIQLTNCDLPGIIDGPSENLQMEKNEVVTADETPSSIPLNPSSKQSLESRFESDAPKKTTRIAKRPDTDVVMQKKATSKESQAEKAAHSVANEPGSVQIRKRGNNQIPPARREPFRPSSESVEYYSDEDDEGEEEEGFGPVPPPQDRPNFWAAPLPRGGAHMPGIKPPKGVAGQLNRARDFKKLAKSLIKIERSRRSPVRGPVPPA